MRVVLLLRRIRKHNCKHIRLVLTQLDIADSPEEWKQVRTHAVSMTLHSLIIARRYSEPRQVLHFVIRHSSHILVSWQNLSYTRIAVRLLKSHTHSAALWDSAMRLLVAQKKLDLISSLCNTGC